MTEEIGPNIERSDSWELRRVEEAYVLTRIWTTPQSQIDSLMPRLWKSATGPPNSS